LINLFRLRNGAALVDLPGYGYADVPDSVRRQWRGLLEHYLTLRQALVGLVMIMDARRPLTDLDRDMINWFGPTGKPIHCLLTKADKLTRQEQNRVLKQVRDEVAEAGSPITVQLFSSLKKIGVAEAEATIAAWLAAS
jgi:GTP-binding protein